MKCLNRVAERLEETVGAAPVEVSKVIKTKFVAMVEGHYLIRVKPPASEATLQNQSSGERAVEGANLPIFGEFELPSSLNGTQLITIGDFSCYKSFCSAIKYTGNKRKRDDEEPSDQPSSKRAKK